MWPWPIMGKSCLRMRMPLTLLTLQGREFGIGALQEESVWYFAFGANMTAKKLTESRGIKPFEATNGFLPGWRLAFNHK